MNSARAFELGGDDGPPRTAGNNEITVLHVDDEESLLDLATAYLRRASDRIEVETATNVSEGMRRLEEGHIDCVVSDYDMPGRDGLVFLDAVRDEYGDLPFILYTGKGSEEIASDAVSKGVTDYLQKETGTDQYTVLANRIENAVEGYRAEQQLFRGMKAMETAREGISLLDEDGVFIYVNRAYAEMVGYEPEELLGEHWKLLYPAGDAEHMRDEILPRVPVEGRWSGETIYVHKDGSEITVDHALSRIDGGGLACVIDEVSGVHGHETPFVDATTGTFDWQRFNEKILDALDDVFYAVDPDFELVRYNASLAEVTGLDPRNQSTTSPTEFVQPDDRGRVTAALDEALRTGNSDVKVELLAADGGTIPFEFRYVRLTDHEGTIVGVVGIGRDVSDREQLETRLRTDEQSIRRLYEVSSDPDRSLEEKLQDILAIGQERLGSDYGFMTRIQEGVQTIVESTGDHELLQPGASCPLSEAYCRKTLDREGVLSIANAVASGWEHDPAHERFGLESYIGSQILVEDELYGTLCFASSTSRTEPFSDAEESFVELLTQWVHYELERERTTDRLRRTNERLEKFASVVSHDLRNPLNVAEGRVDIAIETGDLSHLTSAKEAHDKMRRLIDDLLKLARLGEMIADRESVDLEQVARNAWSVVDTKSATLDVQPGVVLSADRNRLQQLLENLLRNAVEHGGVDVTIRVGAIDDGFYVADNGSGIDEATSEKLFEWGHTTSEDGTGFGLAIVERIAESHDWETTVAESEQGGARFEFRPRNR